MANTVTTKNEKGGAVLYSYNTLIAIKNEGEPLKLTSYWNYSKTMLKHLFAFIKKYAPEVNQKLENSKHKSAKVLDLINKGEILCLK